MPWRRWITFRPWERHSLVLMIGGLVYIGIGTSALVVGDISPRQEVALVVALRMFSFSMWGLIFVTAGVLACLSSRWPGFVEAKWGYSVLTGLASAWSAIYFLGFILTKAPGTNLISAFVWLLVAFLWWGISGLNNPDRRAVMRDGIS